jgi:molybdopterin-guanine dinucleotide biosynthesis protein A
LGYDKKTILLHGEPLIDRLLRRLSAHFSELLVSCNTPFTRTGVQTVRDTLGTGPLAGIYQGLRVCESDYLYVTACDMPHLSSAYIEHLLAKSGEGGCDLIAAVREDGFIEPFNALYHKNALPAIQQTLADKHYKIARALEKLHPLLISPATVAAFNTQNGNCNMFYNINEPRDLEALSGAGCP